MNVYFIMVPRKKYESMAYGTPKPRIWLSLEHFGLEAKEAGLDTGTLHP